MSDPFLALERAVVLEWRPLGMTVRVARRDVEGVEHHAPVHQPVRYRDWELAKEARNEVAPGFLAEVQVETLHGLLRGLVGGEAGPLVLPSAA